MNCDRCGQRVNEVPACEHRFVGQAADGTLRCTYCGHNFGPVRELIEKAGWWDETRGRVTRVESDLRAQVTTLTRERDEARKREHEHLDLLDTYRQIDDKARARIAELERGMLAEGYIELRKNGTWEWRKL